jgi:hypothetical protein
MTYIDKDGTWEIEGNSRMLTEPSIKYKAKNPESELLKIVRTQRNKLLTESDWTQLPDVPLTEEKKGEWRTYRQALRDLPANVNPYKPIFPNIPRGTEKRIPSE